MRILCLTLVAAVLACTSPSRNQLLPPIADPTDVGFAPDGLARIRPAMQRYVDEGQVSGVVTLVARQGRVVHWDAVGFRDLASRDSLRRDDIFRIYSMTKPVTAVAVMMLVEEGAVALDAPVAQYLPVLADVEVLEGGERVPARTPITVADLLGHTSGMTYGLFGNTEVDAMYRDADVFSGDLANLVEEVADLPLLGHPGTVWNYGVSTDVLGYLVETVSGMPLDTFFQTRIFSPLGMVDTDFFVSPDAMPRFTTNYTATGDGLRVQDPPEGGAYDGHPVLLSGGGGLVSTAADYVRFAQMLLNEGELDGVRLLRPETVASMRTNRLPADLIPLRISTWQAPGYGFGLGFSVLVDEDATPEPDHDGIFRWFGYASTYFWIDPEAELIGLAFTQLLPPTVPALEKEFQTLVYEAIEQ